MVKYKTKVQPSAETIDEATKISKSIQRPNQTKEQTKLIAQGIQKGIAEYKKQQKAKARELSKLKKKIGQKQDNNIILTAEAEKPIEGKTQWLAWILLGLSWLGMGLYLVSLR